MKYIFQSIKNMLEMGKWLISGEYFNNQSSTRQSFSSGKITKGTISLIIFIILQIAIIAVTTASKNDVDLPLNVDANKTVDILHDLQDYVKDDINKTQVQDINGTVKPIIDAVASVAGALTDDNTTTAVIDALEELSETPSTIINKPTAPVETKQVPTTEPVKVSTNKKVSKTIAKVKHSKDVEACETCVVKVTVKIKDIPVKEMVPSVKIIEKELVRRGDNPELIKEVIKGYSRKNVNAIFAAYKSSANQFGSITSPIQSSDYEGVFNV